MKNENALLRMGPTKRKIILLLNAGFTIVFTNNFRKQMHLMNNFAREWNQINTKYLKAVVKEFHQDRLVSYKKLNDGSFELILTERGKLRALHAHINNIKIAPPPKWDKLWRIVIFDIPEDKRQLRNALRRKLKDVGFCELQKSVFVFPYDCKKEMDFITEFFGARRYVKYLLVKQWTNMEEWLLRFGLF